MARFCAPPLTESRLLVRARDFSSGVTGCKAAVLESIVPAPRPVMDLPRREAVAVSDNDSPLVSWLDAARPSIPAVSPLGPTFAAPAGTSSTYPAPTVDGPSAPRVPIAASGFANPAPGQRASEPGGGMMRAAAGSGARIEGLESGRAWSLSLPSAGTFDHFPLYTLDSNHGTVLFPNAPQIGIRGESVDLLAQVRDTNVVSYSWDVSGLTHAHAITGSSSYRLQFQWDSTITVTGSPTFVTDTATLTVTNASMETEVQTYTFLIPVGGSVGSPGVASWPTVLTPDTARPESPAFVDHQGSVDSLTGAFRSAITLPTSSPNVPAVSFTYDSLAADPRPIVVANHVLDDSLAVPSMVTARLDFNGGTGATYSYETSTLTPGDVQQVALQTNANGLATGRYAYSMVLGDVRGVTTTTTTSGKFNVVNDSTSPFGAGWSLDGLERVVAVPGEGAILTLGGGRSLWFAGTFTGAGTFATPAGEFSILTRASDGTFSRTLTDGTVDRFDASGQQVSSTDRNGRLTALRRTNGTSGGGGLEGGGLEGSGGGGGSGTAITTTIGYDNADRLTTMSHRIEAGATLASYTYGYDNANRVNSETNAEGTVGYSDDATNQLTGVSGARTESYGYDLAGNRDTTGYTTISGNRMTASPGATYTYDAEGNRTTRTDTTTGNTTTYVYDYNNRLTSVTEKTSSGTLLHQVSYTYDALDRRIGVNTDGTQTWTVYDGQNPYADFNSSGGLSTRYLYGPAVDELLARTSSGGTTAWYLTDRLGSVRDIASTSATVIDHIAYDSFGNVLSESSPSNGDRFKYTAREWDAIASLQHNRLRD